jgi:HAD superfamily hydrolase (TIGR01490 family)
MNSITPTTLHAKKVAAIDLDDCLAQCQTGQKFVFFLYHKKVIPFTFLIKVYVWFIFYKLGIIKNVKEVYVKAVSFAKGLSERRLRELVQEFYDTVLSTHISQSAISYLDTLRKDNFELLIISNSTDAVVSEVAKRLNIPRYFATQLELDDRGVYTGNITGPLMYAEEKARTLSTLAETEHIDLHESTALSDHHSDIFMFELVGHPVAVHPNKKLRIYAQSHQVPVVYF